MRVLVTGGGGFIGRNIVEYLTRYHEVLAPTHAELDLTEPEALDAWFSEHKVDVVVHGAVRPGHRNAADPSRQLWTNLRMFFGLMRNAQSFRQIRVPELGRRVRRRADRLTASPRTQLGVSVPADEHGLSKYTIAQYGDGDPRGRPTWSNSACLVSSASTRTMRSVSCPTRSARPSSTGRSRCGRTERSATLRGRSGRSWRILTAQPRGRLQRGAGLDRRPVRPRGRGVAPFTQGAAGDRRARRVRQRIQRRQRTAEKRETAEHDLHFHGGGGRPPVPVVRGSPLRDRPFPSRRRASEAQVMSTVRVADYLAAQIPPLGVDHVFAVTGGGAMHLDDALRLRSDVHVIFNQHEQACAIAAEGYARASGTLGIAVRDQWSGRHELHNRRTWQCGMTRCRRCSCRARWRSRHHGGQYGTPASPARRPGERHCPVGRADHQVRGDDHRPSSGAVSLREGRLPGPERSARPGLARYPPERAGRQD